MNAPLWPSGPLRALALVAVVVWVAAARGDDAPAKTTVGEWDAPSVGLRLKYTILLPDGYATSGRRYPVLYLLHGYTGNHTSWLTYARLPAASASDHGMILVLPDAGNTFYVNWHGAEGKRPQRWEDAIVKGLVPHIDSEYRTIARREGRAIGGLSMGGYGAVAIAIRHPEKFVAAFSSAGALRFAERARGELRSGKADWNSPHGWKREDRPPVTIKGFSTQEERTPRGKVFTTAGQADLCDPYYLVPRADRKRLPYIHLDCGTEDEGLEESRAFAALLGKHKVPHSYLELPGGHSHPYWRKAVRHSLLIVKDHFEAERRDEAR